MPHQKLYWEKFLWISHHPRIFQYQSLSFIQIGRILCGTRRRFFPSSLFGSFPVSLQFLSRTLSHFLSSFFIFPSRSIYLWDSELIRQQSFFQWFIPSFALKLGSTFQKNAIWQYFSWKIFMEVHHISEMSKINKLKHMKCRVQVINNLLINEYSIKINKI